MFSESSEVWIDSMDSIIFGSILSISVINFSIDKMSLLSRKRWTVGQGISLKTGQGQSARSAGLII